LALTVVASLLPCIFEARAEAASDLADVVVVVDTSVSMKEPGMDPERTSLLVTKLLADLVPGELAVIRLLDLVEDGDLLPSKFTGEEVPCAEDPSKRCRVMAPATDWEADARSSAYGALRRPRRGDAGFKTELESHLAQRSNNSLFHLAFRAAQGVFDRYPAGTRSSTRTLVWLSDGRADEADSVRQVLREIERDGITVEAVVFGAGDPELARSAGLPVRQVQGPGDLMKTFAGAFRRMIGAPYELDGRLLDQPRFTMQPHVDEAWVVVYGGDDLAEVTLTAPDGHIVPADDAAERWPRAGTYRVAHLERPLAGSWAIRAEGGGLSVAYAVVQRSDLAPVWLEPLMAAAGQEVQLAAAVGAGYDKTIVTDREVLANLQLTAALEGRTLSLTLGSDGRFSAPYRFRTSGRVPVEVRLSGDLVDRSAHAEVEVSGSFCLAEPPAPLDLGTLTAGQTACRSTLLEADHEGAVPFELTGVMDLPPGHRLEVRLPQGALEARGRSSLVSPGDPLEVCLVTTASASSSAARDAQALELEAAGGGEPCRQIPLQLSWQVHQLTFWQRWGRVILVLAGILIGVIVALGYALPHRFRPGLAMALAAEREDLGDQSPQPVRQWPGVGIGFYRHARAFLHADYRLSGRLRGALAKLVAEKTGTRVAPQGGHTLFREAADGQWESITPDGRRIGSGDILRVGDRGPFFRIVHRGGKR
jgi:hypothetical protein